MFSFDRRRGGVAANRGSAGDVGIPSRYLLKPGSYKARMVRDDAPNGYESKREYQLLFPGREDADI